MKGEGSGDDRLIPQSEWMPIETMNSDLKILENDLFDRVFDKILEVHKPKKKIAFLSLCTSTRPYSNSQKYKKFKKLFGESVEFVVVSNGGIIPIEYETSYPFMEYDGGGFDPNIKERFQIAMEHRLRRFFENFNYYDFVLANFRPNLRTTPVAKKVLSELKRRSIIKDYAIVPNVTMYRECQNDGFGKPNGVGKMFPDLHLYALEEMQSVLTHFHSLTLCRTKENTRTRNDKPMEVVMVNAENKGKKIEDAAKKKLEDKKAKEEKDIAEEAAKKEREEKEKVRISALMDEHSDTLSEIKTAIEKASQSEGKTLVDYISLSVTLLKSYKLLKKDFYDVVSNNENPILHRQTCLRYLKFVTTKSSHQYIKTNMTKDSFAKVKEDKRVTGLTLEKIKNLNSPSMAKVSKMKELESAAFEAVLNGDDSALSITVAAIKGSDKAIEEYRDTFTKLTGDAKQANKIVKAKQSELLDYLCTAYEEQNTLRSEMRKLRNRLNEMEDAAA